MPTKVLVFGATGRQGGATVDALLAKGGFEVNAIVRNPDSGSAKSLAGRGVKLYKGDFKSRPSMEAAMRDSGASMVFLFTQYHPFKNSAKAEEKQGISALDAIAAVNPDAYLVFASVAAAEKAPAAVKHFWSKVAIEKHLKESSGIKRWFILRPAAFFENCDDPANGNPLKKGKIKMLGPATTVVPWIATADIGKAAVTAFNDPDKWQGKTVTLCVARYTGSELAEVLTEVSGTKARYAKVMPSCLLRMIMPDMHAMMAFMADGGDYADYELTKELVGPELMDFKAWLTAKGAFQNGEKFKA